ncbi:hypothetical protein [Paucibacter sp. DJ2R-2]|uniref:hypothetical protein n=1 Tax=Paucibacter sp. DJ2R-2 TaxID=2893558 RepID=UPI0021E3B83B|nr:hypothetical protein [Paucibacter sp. DJ2R-2]MCV2439858.1 hypothetical protein [Paucibacter sp. DJ2R-2]
MKSTLFAGLSATAILCFTPAASAFAPDLIRGCKVIAAMQKDATPADAIHAAYCLGVLDGILAAVSKKQT